MESLLLIIKKTPLVTWKAFLVLWALFLGFADLTIKLTIKILKFVGQFSGGTGEYVRPDYLKPSNNDGFSSKKKPFITHDKTRWDYDHGIEKKYE
jgi:hypothetical protein